MDVSTTLLIAGLFVGGAFAVFLIYPILQAMGIVRCACDTSPVED
jgi:hypothetical protein